MGENMICVSLKDYQNKCNAEAELEVVKRYLAANMKYGSYDELRVILGMEVQGDA